MTARAHSAAILFSPAPALCYPSRKGAQLDRLFAIGEGIGAFLGGIAQGIGAVVAALLLAIYGLRQWRAQVTRDRDKEREAAEHRRNEARERRRDRERDILIAIRAEVSVEIESLRQFDPAVSRAWEESFIEKLRDRPAAQDGATQPAPQPTRERHETPVGSSTATMFVFDDLKHDLELIPPNCIEEIVRYYKYNQRLDKVIEDFGRGLYEKEDDARQAKAVEAFMELGAKTLMAALKAKLAISDQLGEQTKWSSEDAARLKRLENDDRGPTHLTPPSSEG